MRVAVKDTQTNPPSMKISIYLLALLALLTLSRCADEDTVPPTEIRLEYYTESFDASGLGFEPQLKVTYEYNEDGTLHRYAVLSYDPDTHAMDELRYFLFSYSDQKVEHMNGYLPGATNPYVEYAYQYLPDNRVLNITENNHGAGVNSTATFAYLDNNNVKVSYVFSNGGFFEYEFDYATGNILADKTTRGSQLCSSGQYTYDGFKNPFNDLGYVDYLLTSLSVNNKLTEDIEYTGCSFPTLVPESYTYEYNDKGYPVTATTLYRSNGSVARSKKEFFYGSK
jgi:hypothetical protein